MRQLPTFPRLLSVIGLLAAVILTSACSPDFSLAPEPEEPESPATTLLQVTCTGSVKNPAISCHAPTLTQQIRAVRNAPVAWHMGEDGVKRDVVGGQSVNVQLTSSNVSYNSGTEIFQFDVTVQNLLNEALGSPDGFVQDAGGIKVFFHVAPNATVGTGSIAVANADGTGMFTNSNQAYFQYDEILENNEVSAAKTWQLAIPATVDNFVFTVLVETVAQSKLVINEVGVNPKNPLLDTNGEWFEIYNAGSRPVDLQNLVIADSAPSGRRPYHLISSSVIIPPGGYVVLGNTTNTTTNGGVPVDYAYGGALALTNSLDAVKISRVYGTDTLTIDRTQYASASVSAQDGVTRELKNPALDNSNMDGSNWDNATVTSVFGAWGRGTPRAQNSTYTP